MKHKSLSIVLVLLIAIPLLACKKHLEEDVAYEKQVLGAIQTFTQAFIANDKTKVKNLAEFPFILDNRWYTSIDKLAKPMNYFQTEFKNQNIPQMRFVLEDVEMMSLDEYNYQVEKDSKVLNPTKVGEDVLIVLHTNKLYSGEQLIDVDKNAIVVMKYVQDKWIIKGLN